MSDSSKPGVSTYEDFIARKLTSVPPTGLATVPELHSSLFPFQRDLVTWSLKRGRAALFAECGLGKTAMQLEWARCAGRRALILAPLAVAGQTQREGQRLGIEVTIARSNDDIRDGVNITNYDRIHKFDPAQFDAVVLDESSIIKHHDAKTLKELLAAFASTPFKLCATATPSPNDFTELGTHAEFLGICTRTEMLAEYFLHDGGDTSVWRLKKHARSLFWRWVATWAALARKPSDVDASYDDSRYVLPELTTHQHILPADVATVRAAGLLFAEPAKSLTERRTARKASLSDRIKKCVDLVNSDDERWIVWCDLNAESDMLADAIRGGVEIRGSQTPFEKEQRILKFLAGHARVLISKSSMTGFGLNLQFCNRMAFVGVTDSWEMHHQAIARIYRFGQQRPCQVHIFASEIEGSVVSNLERKAKDAAMMGEELSAETREAMRAEIKGSRRETNAYGVRDIRVPSWLKTEVAC